MCLQNLHYAFSHALTQSLQIRVAESVKFWVDPDSDSGKSEPTPTPTPEECRNRLRSRQNLRDLKTKVDISGYSLHLCMIVTNECYSNFSQEKWTERISPFDLGYHQCCKIDIHHGPKYILFEYKLVSHFKAAIVGPTFTHVP